VFLRPEQNVLLQQLQRRSVMLADMYVGGLKVLADETNPTRFQLAAHAFREMIAHCSELVGAPVVYGDGMKQRLVPVKAAYLATKRMPSVSSGLTADAAAVSVSLIDALDEFFEWSASNRAEVRKKTALLLSQLSGAGPALPSDVIEDDITGWLESDGYFKAVAHHGKAADRGEFVGKLYVIENVLLRRMQPRPVSDLDEIDRLLKEEDSDYR